MPTYIIAQQAEIVNGICDKSYADGVPAIEQVHPKRRAFN